MMVAVAVVVGLLGLCWYLIGAARQGAEIRQIRSEIEAFARLCEVLLAAAPLDGDDADEALRAHLQADYHEAQALLRRLDELTPPRRALYSPF
jgi:hypothetical protein